MYKDLVKGKDGFDYPDLQLQKNNTSNTLLKIIILLIFLQMTRILLKESILVFMGDSILNNYIVSIIIMAGLLFFMVFKSRKEKISLEIFSFMKTKESKSYYIVLTLSTLFLIATSPYFGMKIESILTIVYVLIVLPVYEEIIFRSYVWGKLQTEYKNELKVYLVTTALYSIWHLGYIDIIAMNVGYSSLWIVMIMRCSLMISFGLFIGFFRYKLKNTYSCMLIHSFINIFNL